MDIISKHYKEGQYLKCAKLLGELPTDTLFEKCLVENNVLVSKFQMSFIQKDNLLRNSVSNDLVQLQTKLLALPHKKEYSMLTLCCASNAIYSLLNNDQCCVETSDKAVQIGIGAFEKLICNHGMFFCQETSSIDDTFVGLVHQILCCRNCNLYEFSVVLYICVFIFLTKQDLKYVELVKNVLKTLEDSLKDETSNMNHHIHIFLLSPHEMSLQSSGSYCSTICDFSRLFLFMFYCTNSSWSQALSYSTLVASTNLHDCSAKKSQFSEICEVFKMYASLHLTNSSSDDEIEDHPYEKNSYLYFARCLINAAKFALKTKPLIALKYLNFAAAGKLGRTQACSILMTFAATQFKVLEQSNFEIEALKIAEESLLKCPIFQCSIHTELSGYLLRQMKLFSLPEISLLKYQLARIFLQNKRYQEAAEEYETLNVISHQSTPLSTVFKFVFPSDTIVFHERILAFVLSNNYQKALEAIDESIEEDWFSLYLHAQIFTHRKQYKQAIQLINRSIVKLNSTTFSMIQMKDMIRAKFCFKLSQLFDEIGNMKDTQHQLKLAFQYGISMDSKMLEFYHKFTYKLGAKRDIPLPFDPQQEKVITEILGNSDDLAINYVIRDACT